MLFPCGSPKLSQVSLLSESTQSTSCLFYIQACQECNLVNSRNEFSIDDKPQRRMLSSDKNVFIVQVCVCQKGDCSACMVAVVLLFAHILGSPPVLTQ